MSECICVMCQNKFGENDCPVYQENSDLRDKLEAADKERDQAISDSIIDSTKCHRVGVDNVKLQQENSDLRKQIESMKNCYNCNEELCPGCSEGENWQLKGAEQGE